jgi:methylenetetrahydrofolate dehydrogenase (NADP+)/methenyltetrahydrofolate cyclohydrolase
MAAELIDGEALAARIRKEVQDDVRRLGYAPGLAAVLVGDDPASEIYVRKKQEACRTVGLRFTLHRLPQDTTTEQIIGTVAALNADETVDGILVQLPLPPQADTGRIIASMDPRKDADGFHRENVGLLLEGTPRIVPVLAAGILMLSRMPGVPLTGKHAVLIAKSDEVTIPIRALLQKEGLSVGVVRPDHAFLAQESRRADLLISVVGRPGTVRGDMVKHDAIVIDVGTTRVDGRILGDADASVADAARYRTPVPGGVGPVTVALLLRNTVDLSKLRRTGR